MSQEPLDPRDQPHLAPIPLTDAAHARIRRRIHAEARAVRMAAAEAALHGGFAFAAVVWAFFAAFG